MAFGQLYRLVPVKPVFIGSFVVFGTGSVICATAPSSLVFIIGRAVAGLGGAGIFSGASMYVWMIHEFTQPPFHALTPKTQTPAQGPSQVRKEEGKKEEADIWTPPPSIIANVVPLHNRPVYQGISAGVECVSLALGPAISGAVAHYSSWRTSFLAIAPAALLNVVAVWSLVPSPPPPTAATTKAPPPAWRQLDIPGMVLFAPAATCLALALQQAGTPWGDPRVAAPLAAGAALLLGFAASQRRRGGGGGGGEGAVMLPPGLLGRRCVALASAACFFTSASLYVFGFYLPVYFQAVRGAGPLASGAMYLPSAAGLAVAVAAAGRATAWAGGYYTPAMVAGTVLMAAGAGLMTRLGGDTPPLGWAAGQVVFGLGAGAAFQQPYTAVQTVLEEEHVAAAIVVLSLVQEIGGVAALTVAQNVFIRRMVSRLEGLGLGLDPREVLDHGTLSLMDAVPEKMRGLVYVAYVRTLREVFWIGLVCACLTVCAVGIEWRSVKHEKREETGVYGPNGRDSED